MTRSRALLLAAAVVALATIPVASSAERAWVKDEVRLQKRTGPGTQFRILGALTTGDSVEVLSTAGDWTQIQDGSGEAWIPAGFLQTEPPARVQLERHLSENSELRTSHERLTTEVEELRAANAELSERSATAEERLRQLERENLELRAGARWPEWITGAAVLLVGGILGIIVHASTGRRQTRRIRL